MELLRRNYVKYGLIMSGLIVLCLVYMELTGQNLSFEKSPVVLAITMIAPFVVWFLGIKAFKKAQGNKLTFKQGVKEGFRISLVYGVVSPFVFLLYYILVNPQIVQYAATSYGMANASFGVVVGIDMLVQFVSALIFGTLYAAIISFFLRTKSK